MSSRSYLLGLPVLVTVHDSGMVEVVVDLSEASSGIVDEAAERREHDGEQPVDHEQAVRDGVTVDSVRATSARLWLGKGSG